MGKWPELILIFILISISVSFTEAHGKSPRPEKIKINIQDHASENAIEITPLSTKTHVVFTKGFKAKSKKFMENTDFDYLLEQISFEKAKEKAQCPQQYVEIVFLGKNEIVMKKGSACLNGSSTLSRRWNDVVKSLTDLALI